MDLLIEIKACASGGWLPEAGGLNDQTGGFGAMTKWLAARGIIEGLSRPTL